VILNAAPGPDSMGGRRVSGPWQLNHRFMLPPTIPLGPLWHRGQVRIANLAVVTNLTQTRSFPEVRLRVTPSHFCRSLP
jgi:hypothetical protein